MEREDKKIYYGIKKTPKNQRRATMTEAVEKNKVGYYGIKKIDSKTIQLGKIKKGQVQNLETLRSKLVGIKSVIKRHKTSLQRNLKDSERRKIEKLKDEEEEKYRTLLVQYKNQENNSKNKNKKQKKHTNEEVEEEVKPKKKGLSCPECGMTFNHYSSKSRHMKKQH